MGKKKVVNNGGIEHSAAKRGFSDHSIELYYVDHVETGNPKKAAFILRTDETFGMLTANLQFVFPHAQSSVPDESQERETDEHPVEVITCTDQRDDYSSSESGD
ncbi:hypothetical protein AWC38_SpisGene25599, partial [Stylophora pistillata]